MKVKVLMFAGRFVDAGLLNKGIYTGTMPSIYSEDKTIEFLVEQAKPMVRPGNKWLSDKYLDNLSKCTLVEYDLTPTIHEKQ